MRQERLRTREERTQLKEPPGRCKQANPWEENAILHNSSTAKGGKETLLGRGAPIAVPSTGQLPQCRLNVTVGCNGLFWLLSPSSLPWLCLLQPLQRGFCSHLSVGLQGTMAMCSQVAGCKGAHERHRE